MKKLILDVTCINSNFNDAPDHFVAEISHKQIERIKELMTVVKENDLYSLEYFCASGEYFSSQTMESLCEDHQDESFGFLTESMVLEAEDDSTRVELQQVIVYEDAVKFTCVPKHCGDAEGCYSDKVSLEQLCLSEPFIAATL